MSEVKPLSRSEREAKIKDKVKVDDSALIDKDAVAE